MSGLRTWFGRRLDQDWVDLANGFWSVLLLTVLSAGAFLMRYITEPISCWVPAQFEDSQYDYAKKICFMKDVHYLVLESAVPRAEPQSPVLSYHLWIPMILFFQALCFKIPNIIWNTGKYYLTHNLDETVETLKQAQISSAETRKSVFQDAARVLGQLLESNKFFLAILYLLVKLLFLLNLLGQFVFLTLYFRNYLVVKTENYLGFNITNVVQPLFHKLEFLCDFEIRQRANVHRYMVQCTLPITEIYEKMFVFLWYWVFLLAVVSFFNLLLWVGFLFLPFLRNSRISAYIKASPRSSQVSSGITRFISGFLGIDGVLVLSMISRNSSELVAANLSQQLYHVFLEKGSGYQAVPSTSEGETTDASAPSTNDVPLTNLNYPGDCAEKSLVT